MELSNGKIQLRELTENDWIDVHKYASKEIVCQYQPWGPNTEEESRNFVKQVMKDSREQPRNRYVFAIVFEGRMVGAAEINHRDLGNRSGEIAYIVNPTFWRKGIATEAAKLLIKFGFEKLKLHRIYATCDPRNIQSSKVLEKIGMVKEGRIRDALLIKDGWRDSFIYSILEHEWTT